MHRVSWFGLFILVFAILPLSRVGAEARQYSDLQGRCTIAVPARFVQNSPSLISVLYSAAGEPGSRLSDLVEQSVAVGRSGASGFALGQNGIQPALLGGEPALQYDYSMDDYLHPGSGNRALGTQITAIHQGVYFQLSVLGSEHAFDTLRNEIPAIVDSFHYLPSSIVAGVYTDPLGRFTFAAPSGYDLVPNIANEVTGQELSLVTLSAQPLSDGGSGSYLTVRTLQESLSFDALFNIYETQGQAFLARDSHVEQPPSGIRHATLDGHPVGVRDYYLRTDGGARSHITSVITVIGATQYVIYASMLDGDISIPSNMLDGVLSSFHFQTTA